MNIAIIGAGNVGSALARSTTRAGHNVTITSRDGKDAAEVAQSASAHLASTNREAVESAEIVILAVPADAVPGVAEELADALATKAVIDVANRPTPDPTGRNCRSHAEELQERIPTAGVVKALNTVFAARQKDPSLDGTDVDGYVAGDDPDAKRAVLQLVESLGFKPYDVGGLTMARTLEGMGWLHISLAMQNGWSWQSAWKIVGPKQAAAKSSTID
jgi:8-hydroxy-5-deazaflavin:NADPH oxidoreductase